MGQITQTDDDIVITAALRTPFDRFGGVMRNVPTYQLGAWVIKALLERVGLEGAKVDKVILGMCELAEAALRRNVMARQALLAAGLPDSTVSLTVDRACCSSTAATQIAFNELRLDEGEIYITGGSENMSRQPFLTDPVLRWEGPKHGHLKLIDPEYDIKYEGYGVLAVDAGQVALEHGVSRQEQDEWAYISQQRYAKANKEGKFAEEIIPITISEKNGSGTVLEHDTNPRPETTLEKLAKLPLVLGSPTVTAGNAPGLNTGGSGLLLMKRKTAKKLGVPVLATIIASSSSATVPREIATAPAGAIRKVLQRAGLSLEDISLLEINEAFAAVPLVSTKLLAEGNEAKWNFIKERTNVNGGAVAVGHPVGATGTRLIMTLMYELRRMGGGYGIASICGGLAQADSVLIRVD